MRSHEEVLRHVAQASKAPTRLSFLICATPRSGSTLLCEYLSLTGVAGVPDEWMLPTNEAWAKESFGITSFDDPRYLSEIIALSRTPNGVFGAKVMWPEMDQLRLGARWDFKLSGPAIHHSDTLPNLHYIRMSRRDRLRQAISFFLAVRTNYWHKMRRDAHVPAPWPLEALEAELNDRQTRSAVLDDVSARLGFIEQQENEWDRFFATERIAPFEVSYETLVGNPVEVTLDLLRFLGLTAPDALDFSRTGHMPMSDERNELLLAAYNERISSVVGPLRRPSTRG